MSPTGEKSQDTFDTVMLAIGRKPETERLNLAAAGVVAEKSGKLLVRQEQTNVPHIYALGDIIEGVPELTPSAIQAGLLLANRFYKGSTIQMDYEAIPTTVFTPLEYGSVGLSEETAIARYGEENIEVYHAHWQPLEFTVPHHPENQCYMKMICNLADSERVLGMHYLGPNAGEVIQGFGLTVKLGATKADMDNLVGIHPTNAETFAAMKISKRSGVSPELTGC
jgi:thioredoxin reductase (NADPH)